MPRTITTPEQQHREPPSLPEIPSLSSLQRGGQEHETTTELLWEESNEGHSSSGACTPALPMQVLSEAGPWVERRECPKG